MKTQHDPLARAGAGQDAGPLFAAPHNGTTTSKAAASAIAADAKTLRSHVFTYLKGCGADGATDEEIQDALEMDPSTERPRRGELVTQGVVVDSGRTRPTRSGRKAVVWIAK